MFQFDDFRNHLKLIIATSELEVDGDDLVGVVKRILDEHTHYQNEIKVQLFYLSLDLVGTYLDF